MALGLPLALVFKAPRAVGCIGIGPLRRLLTCAEGLEGQGETPGANLQGHPARCARYLLWRAAVESDQELEAEMSPSGMVRSCMPRA